MASLVLVVDAGGDLVRGGGEGEAEERLRLSEGEPIDMLASPADTSGVSGRA